MEEPFETSVHDTSEVRGDEDEKGVMIRRCYNRYPHDVFGTGL